MKRHWLSEAVVTPWSWKLELRNWFISLLVALPFLSLYAAHFLWRRNATGFLDYDMPFYVAIGRSIFAHGNGILYANPYDIHGSIIYFHWFPWFLGVGTAVLHLDAGYLYASLGIVLAIGLARITLALVECVTGAAHGWPMLSIAFWGGGLLVIGGVIRSLLLHLPIHRGILFFDLGDGLWFLNWGRNSIFTTESLYHVLAAGLWLGILKKRWAFAISMLLLIATTHPWTGAEMLAIVFVYLCWSDIRRSAMLPPWWFQISVFLIASGFGWYYGIYLPSYLSHTAILNTWNIPVVLNKLGFVLSIAPVGLLALYRFHKGPIFTHRDSFLVICFIVSSLLSIHDLWMRPVTPVHFDRGYPWMALFLLGIPVFTRISLRKNDALMHWVKRLVAGMLVLITLSDNAAFLQWRWRFEINAMSGLNLSQPERKLFYWLDSTDTRGTLMARSRALLYLSGAYANVSPYFVNEDVTPNFIRRCDSVERVYSGDTAAIIPANVSLMLIERGENDTVHLNPNEWKLIYDQEDLRLFRRNHIRL